MALSSRHVTQAAYVIGEELAWRKRSGRPIYRELLDLHRALLSEMSASGQQECENTVSAEVLETTTDVADRIGVNPRTVRRRAARRGYPKTGGRYIFTPEDS
jgi:hypothetical protein